MQIQILVLILLISQIGYSQDWECDLLDKGLEYYEQEKLDSAIIIWKSVVENYPDTSNCYGRSYNNIPIVYAQLENTIEAKNWYQKIIDSKLNDLDEGDGIMSPYANYKHNSCLRMAFLLKEEDEIEESFKYIRLAETKFPYQTFSATSFEKRAVLIAFDKAELWKLKGNNKEAVLVMLEKILDDDVFFRKTDAASFTNVDFYAELIEEIKPMIQEQYRFEEFEKKLKEAINYLEVKTVRIGKKREKAKVAIFTFEGKEFIIGSSNKKYNKKKFKNRLLNNRIFDEIKNEN
jgi:tetratricopeptide (TPR) repeat protein